MCAAVALDPSPVNEPVTVTAPLFRFRITVAFAVPALLLGGVSWAPVIVIMNVETLSPPDPPNEAPPIPPAPVVTPLSSSPQDVMVPAVKTPPSTAATMIPCLIVIPQRLRHGHSPTIG